MSPLLKIRSERDQMSAIERRIADFLLDNAHLLRDYSSQQLADALGISQSSVVKFSQKLGFKGYPDLKYSIGEAVARSNGGDDARRRRRASDDPHAALAENLWHGKAQAEEETRLINPPETHRRDRRRDRQRRQGLRHRPGRGRHCRRAHSRMKLSLLGILTVHHFDPVLMTASISTAAAGDVLLVFSEHGQQAALCQIARQFRERQRQGRLGHPPHRQSAARARRRVAAGLGARRALAHRTAAVPVGAAAPARPDLRAAVRGRRGPPAAQLDANLRAHRRHHARQPEAMTHRMPYRATTHPRSCACWHRIAVAAAPRCAGTRDRQPADRPWADARQLVLVTTADWNANQRHAAHLRARRRRLARSVGRAVPVTIGRAGSAWGIGLHPAQPGEPSKREGDGRAPAGVFRIGTAFGYADTARHRPALRGDDGLATTASTSTPRRSTTASSMRDDVGEAAIAGSTEPMRRDLHANGDQRYKLGFVIEHNAAGTPRRRQLHLRAPVEGARRNHGRLHRDGRAGDAAAAGVAGSAAQTGVRAAAAERNTRACSKTGACRSCRRSAPGRDGITAKHRSAPRSLLTLDIQPSVDQDCPCRRPPAYCSALSSAPSSACCWPGGTPPLAARSPTSCSRSAGCGSTRCR